MLRKRPKEAEVAAEQQLDAAAPAPGGSLQLQPRGYSHEMTWDSELVPEPGPPEDGSY